MSIWTRTLATVLAMSLVVTTAAQNASDTEFNKKRTISIGIVIFPGFEPLDVFGSLDILVSMSSIYKMTLSLIASSAGPVSMGIPRHQMEPNMPPMDLGHMLRPTILATHSFLDAPALDVLLIPGGVGNVVLEQHNDTSVEDFVKLRYDQVDYMMSVCTGAVSLAKSGVLDGKRATTNKFAWASATTYGKGVKWVPTARWVVDGKVWTSSGVSAGIDMMFAFMKHLYGEKDESLQSVMNTMEYAPHADPNWDPFSIVWKVPGANMNSSVADCVRPVGY